MRIPGFGAPRPIVPPTESSSLPLERRPGESVDAYEERRAAYARERLAAGATFPDQRRADADHRRDQPRVETRDRVEKRPRRHRGFPLISLLIVLVAAIGIVWLVLAAREGSFAAGGAVVDQKVSQVTAPARAAASQAVDRTGAAVQNAGQALENQGERIRDKAQ